MKKAIAIVMAVLLVLGMLCGCASFRKCDSCGAKGAGNKYEGKHLCDDCYKIVEAAEGFKDQLEGLGDFDFS